MHYYHVRTLEALSDIGLLSDRAENHLLHQLGIAQSQLILCVCMYVRVCMCVHMHVCVYVLAFYRLGKEGLKGQMDLIGTMYNLIKHVEHVYMYI